MVKSGIPGPYPPAGKKEWFRVKKGVLTDYYAQMKRRFLTQCVECGACVRSCKVYPHMPVRPAPREIIRGMKSFIGGGETNAAAELYAQACMYCFGCSDRHCPAGIDSLVIQELYQREIDNRSPAEVPVDLYADHKARMRRFATPDEYARMTTARFNPSSRLVLFPGCNVYRQPDKVLNLLDIMDAISPAYTFLPGIEYCCGNMGRIRGDADMMERMAGRLIDRLMELRPETVVFWCPTCACNVKHIFDHCRPSLPFEIITFGTYMRRNIDKMRFPAAKPCRVTLHEPCKSVYMGVDTDDIRSVLRRIPGTELVEMAHHHENTMCCGCAAVADFPEVGSAITGMRLDEAKATGAAKMLDVCHFCHWVFRNYQDAAGREEITVENYSTYIAEAMGISRPDCMRPQN